MSKITNTPAGGNAHEQIRNTIDQHPVVLFMKGTPDFPMCGFSGTVVAVLQKLDVAFHAVNVLDSADIRQGIKDYSSWPTIPQLYVKQSLVGGCDIVVEMAQAGELQALFQEKTIPFQV